MLYVRKYDNQRIQCWHFLQKMEYGLRSYFLYDCRVNQLLGRREAASYIVLGYFTDLVPPWLDRGYGQH